MGPGCGGEALKLTSLDPSGWQSEESNCKTAKGAKSFGPAACIGLAARGALTSVTIMCPDADIPLGAKDGQRRDGIRKVPGYLPSSKPCSSDV